jgi:hypothetical protein
MGGTARVGRLVSRRCTRALPNDIVVRELPSQRYHPGPGWVCWCIGVDFKDPGCAAEDRGEVQRGGCEDKQLHAGIGFSVFGLFSYVELCSKGRRRREELSGVAPRMAK